MKKKRRIELDAKSSKCRAIRLTIVDGADAVRAVYEVNSVHAVDADRQNALDVAFVGLIVFGDRGDCRNTIARESKATSFFIVNLRDNSSPVTRRLALSRGKSKQ
jgi:hypothetical protein